MQTTDVFVVRMKVEGGKFSEVRETWLRIQMQALNWPSFRSQPHRWPAWDSGQIITKGLFLLILQIKKR